MIEKPYPVDPGYHQYVFARTAETFLPDIEAYLVEHELSTVLAPAVAGLMNQGFGIVRAIEALVMCLRVPLGEGEQT